MKRFVNIFIAVSFVFNVFSPYSLQAQTIASYGLPQPGTLLNTSKIFSYPVLKGVKLDPKNPTYLEFIIDAKDKGNIDRQELSRLVSYFLACLTIPEDDLWVNLSPYEQERITSEKLAETDLGKDMLGQDYILKQLAASLTYPETPSGKAYWGLVNSKSSIVNGSDQFTIRNLQFTNGSAVKVWIVPGKSLIYEDNGTAVIKESGLKAQTETQSLAMKNIIPLIEKEVNSGENFARLRQIHNAFLLASWFKKKMKDSAYKYYIDQHKVKGIDLKDKNVKENIYNLYVEAFKKGAYDYARSERMGQKIIKRSYFSGGVRETSQDLEVKDNAGEVAAGQTGLNAGVIIEPKGPMAGTKGTLKQTDVSDASEDESAVPQDIQDRWLQAASKLRGEKHWFLKYDATFIFMEPSFDDPRLASVNAWHHYDVVTRTMLIVTRPGLPLEVKKAAIERHEPRETVWQIGLRERIDRPSGDAELAKFLRQPNVSIDRIAHTLASAEERISPAELIAYDRWQLEQLKQDPKRLRRLLQEKDRTLQYGWIEYFLGNRARKDVEAYDAMFYKALEELMRELGIMVVPGPNDSASQPVGGEAGNVSDKQRAVSGAMKDQDVSLGALMPLLDDVKDNEKTTLSPDIARKFDLVTRLYNPHNLYWAPAAFRACLLSAWPLWHAARILTVKQDTFTPDYLRDGLMVIKALLAFRYDFLTEEEAAYLSEAVDLYAQERFDEAEKLLTKKPGIDIAKSKEIFSFAQDIFNDSPQVSHDDDSFVQLMLLRFGTISRFTEHLPIIVDDDGIPITIAAAVKPGQNSLKQSDTLLVGEEDLFVPQDIQQEWFHEASRLPGRKKWFRGLEVTFRELELSFDDPRLASINAWHHFDPVKNEMLIVTRKGLPSDVKKAAIEVHEPQEASWQLALAEKMDRGDAQLENFLRVPHVTIDRIAHALISAQERGDKSKLIPYDQWQLEQLRHNPKRLARLLQEKDRTMQHAWVKYFIGINSFNYIKAYDAMFYAALEKLAKELGVIPAPASPVRRAILPPNLTPRARKSYLALLDLLQKSPENRIAYNTAAFRNQLEINVEDDVIKEINNNPQSQMVLSKKSTLGWPLITVTTKIDWKTTQMPLADQADLPVNVPIIPGSLSSFAQRVYLRILEQLSEKSAQEAGVDFHDMAYWDFGGGYGPGFAWAQPLVRKALEEINANPESQLTIGLAGAQDIFSYSHPVSVSTTIDWQRVNIPPAVPLDLSYEEARALVRRYGSPAVKGDYTTPDPRYGQGEPSLWRAIQKVAAGADSAAYYTTGEFYRVYGMRRNIAGGYSFRIEKSWWQTQKGGESYWRHSSDKRIDFKFSKDPSTGAMKAISVPQAGSGEVSIDEAVKIKWRAMPSQIAEKVVVLNRQDYKRKVVTAPKDAPLPEGINAWHELNQIDHALLIVVRDGLSEEAFRHAVYKHEPFEAEKQLFIDERVRYGDRILKTFLRIPGVDEKRIAHAWQSAAERTSKTSLIAYDLEQIEEIVAEAKAGNAQRLIDMLTEDRTMQHAWVEHILGTNGMHLRGLMENYERMYVKALRKAAVEAGISNLPQTVSAKDASPTMVFDGAMKKPGSPDADNSQFGGIALTGKTADIKTQGDFTVAISDRLAQEFQMSDGAGFRIVFIGNKKLN